MKRTVYTILALPLLTAFAVALPAAAQSNVAVEPEEEELVTTYEPIENERPRLSHEILDDERRDEEAARLVDLPLGSSPLSRLDMAPAFGFYSPWALGSPTAWTLHEGFNAEVGFSVSASFGKNRIKGVGFGEHLAAAYAMPFGKDKRWIGAIGVYADRLDWGSYNRMEAGIAGILGYNVNDWCNLYVYGAYNFVPGFDSGPNPYASRFAFGPYGCYGGYSPYGCYGGPFDPYANLRGRIGAAAEFKVGRAASITVAFEHDFYDTNCSPLPVVPPPTADQQKKPFNVYDPQNSTGRGGNGRR